MALVICSGLAVLDHVFYLTEIPKKPIKSFASEYHTVGGGNAATAAVAICRAGGKALYWGRLGDDRNGDLILEELEEYGVDVGDVSRLEGVNSGVSSVLIDEGGERLITNYSDPKLVADANWLPTDKLKKAGSVLADLGWHEGAFKTLRQARDIGIPAVLDADLSLMGLNEEVIGSASHVLFSQPALDEFSKGKSTLEALKQAENLNNGWVGVTEGSSGITWLENGKIRHLPAFKISTLDTLGAGDVFHGIFALGLAEGKKEDEALLWASAAAALKCSRKGGRDVIPKRKEIDVFLKKTS